MVMEMEMEMVMVLHSRMFPAPLLYPTIPIPWESEGVGSCAQPMRMPRADPEATFDAVNPVESWVDSFGRSSFATTVVSSSAGRALFALNMSMASRERHEHMVSMFISGALSRSVPVKEYDQFK